MWAPTEIIYIGDEYAPAMEYFDLAIRTRISEMDMGETALGYLRIGLLKFLAIHFPEHKEFYIAQLPEPTPTPTLTPTSTQTSNSTPTPTYTFTPTSTSTSSPTPTSTSTPEPTVTPTPTQATLLIVTNNFINDLQEGENSYLLVVIFLILVLMVIGIGVIIYKRVKRR